MKQGLFGRDFSGEIETVAVIGGGPAGSAVATLLAKAGLKVAIFADEKRPELIIGESLIPGVIPVLDALGVEDEISRIGTFKPGATIYFTPEFEETFFFNVLEDPLHQYAFNVPRDQFDAILLRNAVDKGAKLFHLKAKLMADPAKDTVLIDPETVQRTEGFFTSQPDLLIDCSGRARTFARLLGIRESMGPRRDTALFAHRDRAEIVRRGNIHVTVFPEGWSWRIPLRDRISVGIVAPPEYFEQYGSTPIEQYEAALANDPYLAPTVTGSTRLTGVMKYNNYQLTSERMHGANWAMVGDAAGFIDPVFSSGLCISLNGAADISETLMREGPAGFPGYETRTKDHLAAWRLVVDSFYDKTFYNLLQWRQVELKRDRISRLERARYVQISRIIAGVDTRVPSLVEDYRSVLEEVREMAIGNAA